MTLFVPNASLQTLLRAALNHTAPQNQTLKLFTNNKTPAAADVAADYTEAVGNGYASKALTGSSWSVTSADPAVATYAEQVFLFTGALGSIYGYFIVQASSGLLLWAERFASAPRVISANGDQLRVTPRIELDQP